MKRRRSKTNDFIGSQISNVAVGNYVENKYEAPVCFCKPLFLKNNIPFFSKYKSFYFSIKSLFIQ